ncbi:MULTISPECIES: MBL fold metallo-hydrolase [unclassified Kitasatospora]|uniref:MBL fold metallo-hydrolase n=1 Tax=unclassified Kitasatospora TaxID=2633591 RepID=UPI00070AC5EB|nr:MULTISPECIES: MBL fold metallo-hydrolase [unclassified Kitasatospora]KQV21812.1 MBL fold metallo-hydrolase [Kitasatospora sp. Root107]KRB75396.1 MBL fold metallo-hydrolase [Kitasatospora sp. Root187]
MSTLDHTILDLDFPAGAKAKTATLVTGETDALLVDAAFTRADGHRIAAAVLDSGKTLKQVFVSHGDPDFYFGAEVIADAFPDAVFTATPTVLDHIRHSYEGKLKAWADTGVNLPTRLVDLQPQTQDISLEGHVFQLKGQPAELPMHGYLFQPETRWLLGGVLVFSGQHVWVADTATDAQQAAWISLLDEMEAHAPRLVVPGHRAPGAPADISAIRHTRDYLKTFADIVAATPDGDTATAELFKHYPELSFGIAAQLSPKVVKGEMPWG